MHHTGPLRILDFPPELVGIICSHLSVEDLFSVRQVCKALDQNFTHALGLLVFCHLHVILHPLGLASCFGIAKHPQISKYVTKIVVSGERLGHKIPMDDEQLHNDTHHYVDKSGLSIRILRHMLTPLPNFKFLEVSVTSWSLIDKNVDGRFTSACGRASLLEGRHQLEDEARDRQEEHRRCLLFEMILLVLAESDPEGRISLSLVSIAYVDKHPYKTEILEPFDLSSGIWADAIHAGAVTFASHNDVNLDWISRSLRTIQNLRDVDISGPCFDTEEDEDDDDRESALYQPPRNLIKHSTSLVPKSTGALTLFVHNPPPHIPHRQRPPQSSQRPPVQFPLQAHFHATLPSPPSSTCSPTPCYSPSDQDSNSFAP